MTLRHIALAALMMACSASLSAQTAPQRPAPGSDQNPVPGERHKRGSLLDIVRAIAPPLIDAVTSRPPPPPPREPVPEPVAEPAPQPVPELVVEPAATPVPPATRPPLMVAPEAAIAPAASRPVPPRRKLVPLDRAPAPAASSPSPQSLEAPAPSHAQLPPTVPPISAPAPVQMVPPPSPVTDPVPPPIAIATQADATPGRADWWLLLLVAGALGVAAAAVQRLRRLRQIAHTRAVLAIDPRLDSNLGDCSTGGLALAGPRFSIHARLLPVGHG